MKYRKKLVVIKAVQIPLERPINNDKAAQGHAFVWLFLKDSNWKIANELGEIDIITLEGTMRASLGDWIIKGVKGEFYPCKNEVFLLTYEEVEN